MVVPHPQPLSGTDQVSHQTLEQRHDAIVFNAQETNRLLAAIKMLKTTDFSTMMGSGIVVNLKPITRERVLCEEFMIAAEDMTNIAPKLVESITRSLTLRLDRLRREVQEIEQTVNK